LSYTPTRTPYHPPVMRKQSAHQMGFMEYMEWQHRLRHSVNVAYSNVATFQLRCTRPIPMTFYDELYAGVIRGMRSYLVGVLRGGLP